MSNALQIATNYASYFDIDDFEAWAGEVAGQPVTEMDPRTLAHMQRAWDNRPTGDQGGPSMYRVRTYAEGAPGAMWMRAQDVRATSYAAAAWAACGLLEGDLRWIYRGRQIGPNVARGGKPILEIAWVTTTWGPYAERCHVIGVTQLAERKDVDTDGDDQCIIATLTDRTDR